MKKKIFITTAIDYTNEVIHIGHAYEKVLADCVARYERKRRGEENVLFTTGTDEHGTTSEKAAEKRGLKPEKHVSDISKKDRKQLDALNVSYDRFIRTTDKDHIKTSIDFYKKAFDNGDIYKSKYQGFYCEGCEAQKTLTELDENGQCSYHPSREIQKLDEENYFFKWARYSNFLKNLIKSNRLLVQPKGKRKEMLSFLEGGLHDITVSRPKYKVSWGVTTPNDPEQVIYVWYDALINYYTEGKPKGFWDENTEIVHFVGKDIIRWHVLLWPAMLESVGSRLPDRIYIHGFINLEGQKISKSLGNVIRPTEIVEKYGCDTVRYYLLKHGPIVEDVDISIPHLEEVYNADLANGLGNTVSRLAKLAEISDLEFELAKEKEKIWDSKIFLPLNKDFRVDVVLQNIWKRLGNLDKHINENEPWSITDKDELKIILQEEINELREIAKILEPFIPETSRQIQKQFGKEIIKSERPLFPRL